MLALAFAAAIIADSALVRSGLHAILGAAAGLRVVASTSAEQARTLEAEGVDVVVRDMSDSASEAVGDGPPGVPVLALTDEPERTRELVRRGARGVVSREASAEHLAAASLAVAAGLHAFDESALESLLSRGPSPSEPTLFTPRELAVLELVADGLSNKLIADRLGISEHTAKFHVRSLFDKLGADTRADLVARAARRGVLAL
jgi:two-component system nitrate/nitrite response regulator NarL